MQSSNTMTANFSNASFTDFYFVDTDLSDANVTGITWSNTFCPDGTNSDDDGSTCIDH